jgi:hypothetical protein
LVFGQTAAPTGWTKLTTQNDAALRVVSGAASSGGTVGFTTAFASQAVGGTISNTTSTGSNSSTTATGSLDTVTATGTIGSTTLTTAQMPSHNHTSQPIGTSGGLYGLLDTGNSGSSGGFGTSLTGGGGSHNHTFTGTGHTHTFTGTAHTHTITMNAHTHTFTGTAINLAVKYVDVILASKD